MNENLSNWIENLTNKAAIANTFGGRSPSLERLRLTQIVIGQMGDFHISLNFPELPEHSPERWTANGNDSVQLRLSFFDLTKLSISGDAHEGNLDVAAYFGPGAFFTISSTQFNVKLRYGYVKADLYPFNSAVFEEPRDWYRR
ncbi:MAG TPA: Imm50 family immunity protein [Pseudoduganella sp.]